MKRNFICNLFIAVLFCCGFTANAQSLRDEGVSAKLAPGKTQFKAASVGYVYGDVNGDEKTDISDIVSIINAISQDDGSNPRADVNEDGSIDISDIVKVINIIAGVDTPPITVDRSILNMTTGESEDVRIVRVSGSGDYEVTNENPDIVTVEWLSDSPTASERRKVKAAGETEIGEGDSFSADGFLKVYALQPGQAKITVVDKNTSKKLIVSITVTADYNTEIFSDISPLTATEVSGTSVACKLSVIHPWSGRIKCRLFLSTKPDLSETVKTINFSLTADEGEKTYYNEDGSKTTFSSLKYGTKYYWRILYNDKQTDEYVYGSPILWFKTEDPAVTAGLCPDSNHPHIIDMGDAGKWSCCNIGAKWPWEYGGYYAWGETNTKNSYSWTTYTYCDGSEESCQSLGPDISGTQYDAAHVKFGNNWCMPSWDKVNLLFNCSFTRTTINHIPGAKITAPNGSSLFLPAAGLRSGLNNNVLAKIGYYWLSTGGQIFSFNANALNVNDYGCGHVEISRFYGCPIRPVISETTNIFRYLILAHQEVNVNYTLYKKPDLTDYRINADSTVFYKSSLILNVGKKGIVQSYVVCNDLYLCEGDGQPQCMALDFNTKKIHIFSNSKSEEGPYSMDGYHFVSSIDNINFTADTVFAEKNQGWWPYFTYSEGFLKLHHFNNEEKCTLTSIRDDKSVWDAGQTEFINLEDYKARWKVKGPMLVIKNETPLCPDNNHPHVIDLGIGVKFACCNIGASVPWEDGGYYAWGETEEKDVYDWSTYVHCDGSKETCHDLGNDISGSPYDVAHVKWGKNWCMPNTIQIDLLVAKCTAEWTTINSKNGVRFTGPNGNSIFLPAVGGQLNDVMNSYDSHCYYWSSTKYENGLAYNCRFSKDYYYKITTDRVAGCPVRPVISESESEDPAVTAGLCPDSNHPHIIDMGEAGKWACCNVGASAP